MYQAPGHLTPWFIGFFMVRSLDIHGYVVEFKLQITVMGAGIMIFLIMIVMRDVVDNDRIVMMMLMILIFNAG